MERNLLHAEIENLRSGSSQFRDHFFGSALPLAAYRLTEAVKQEAALEQQGYSASTLYGGFSLTAGDDDTQGKYGGVIHARAKHVLQLQHDLVALGFRIRTKKPDGAFDFETELAVREFQIYSKMDFVAVQGSRLGPASYYGELLERHRNDAKYTGLVSGVVNAETRRRILFWQQQGYRCPVIVETWSLTKKKTRSKIVKGKDNIWHYKDVVDSGPRMYVRDFTNYYTTPSGKVSDGLVALGYYSRFRKLGGPSSEKNVSWPESEITPQMFLRKPFTSMTGPEKSTFKVIRAVSEVECGGRVDQMNAYDDAFVSFGPFHWVFAIFSYAPVDKSNPAKGKKLVISKGEIAAYFAFLKERDPGTFTKVCSFFGVDVTLDWNADGVPYFERSQRKYVKGKVKLQRESGFLEMPESGQEGMDFCNYFRSWHWFYRFVMAARTIPGFQQQMFDFAIFRLKNLLDMPVENFAFRDGSGSSYKPKLAELVTSEQAVAMTLRVHVRAPAFVSHLGRAGAASTFRTILRNGLANMTANGLADVDRPSRWGDAHERILIDVIKNHTYSVGGLNQSVPQVCDYVGTDALSGVRNSFSLLTR